MIFLYYSPRSICRWSEIQFCQGSQCFRLLNPGVKPHGDAQASVPETPAQPLSGSLEGAVQAPEASVLRGQDGEPSAQP